MSRHHTSGGVALWSLCTPILCHHSVSTAVRDAPTCAAIWLLTTAEIRSAIISTVAFVLERTQSGISDASTTRSPLTLCTFPSCWQKQIVNHSSWTCGDEFADMTLHSDQAAGSNLERSVPADGTTKARKSSSLSSRTSSHTDRGSSAGPMRAVPET